MNYSEPTGHLPDEDYADEEFEEEFYASLTHAIESAAVFVLCATSFLGNILTIVTTACLHRKKRQAVDIYILSLSVADLLSGVLVIPSSLVATSNAFPNWTYVICSVSGYMHASLCAVCLYTFMWLSVDRYVATKKPLRYDAIQTRTRCACWVLFSWVMSMSLCCPPLLGNTEGHFYRESFKCMINISAMLPYSITVGFLVLSPTVLTLLYTYGNIIGSPRTSPTAVKDDAVEEETDVVTPFLVTLLFFVSWTPWCIMKFIEAISARYAPGDSTRFWLLWIGELHALWTPFVLTSTSFRIREGLSLLCHPVSVQGKDTDVIL